MHEAMSRRAASIMASGVLGGMGGCTTMRTLPLYMRPSCPFGIRAPVPISVTGTTGTFAFAATENAPCRHAHAPHQHDLQQLQVQPLPWQCSPVLA